jgi:transposase
MVVTLEYVLYPHNLGEYLSIDEVALSKGELVTIVTNKAGKGKRGSVVAIIQGVRKEEITKVLAKIPLAERKYVKEITMDMARNMERAMADVFPDAKRVTDHFHVSGLVNEVVQSLRVKLRWKALETEAEAIKTARSQGTSYKANEYVNGDTEKQLLARSRYLLYKNKHTWTLNQELRASILFKTYPTLYAAYEHGQAFLALFRHKDKEKARQAFEKWIRHTYDQKREDFYPCARSLESHIETILNFFDHRSTNAAAESFNAKIKGFRALGRGVSDPLFFLFRIEKLFA